jgi:imidazolonepropionase-like amidohydrolase
VPQGGIISGTSSVVQLDAWNWEDATYKTDEGIHLNWPSYLYNKFTDDMTGSAFNEKYSQQTEYIRQFFEQAKAYSQLSVPTKVNLRFEAMKELFTGKKNLYIHASYVKEIMSAVAFARQLGIKAVIVGGADAWKCADLLKKNNVPVVLQRTQVRPGTRDEDVNQPYKIAARLQKAGVLYCITDAGYWQQRNLPFQAGEAAGFGLSKEEALEAITLNAAKILGISNQTGSLESGKDANIIISDGDILDMATNHITMAFIQGRQLNLYNSQEYLYDMYRKKYGVR